MYDKVKLWLPSGKIQDSNYLSRLQGLLTDVAEHKNKFGQYYITGRFENLYCSVGKSGLSIQGSLNKFWHTYNFKRLTRQETELSLNKISDSLSIDIFKSNVKKLEIGSNFIMNEPVKEYYYYLGYSSQYNRLEQPETINYKNSLRELIFYDKVKEGESKNMAIPEIWQNKHVLRYELKFHTALPKQFKTGHITAENLCNEEIYINTIDYYLNEYNSIQKNKLLIPTAKNLTSKQAKEYLLSKLIAEHGLNKVLKDSEQWKDSFSNPKEAQRFKASLKNNKYLNEQSQLIEELNQKINSVKMFYR